MPVFGASQAVGLESAEVNGGKAAKRSPSGNSGNPTRQVYPVTISHLPEKASCDPLARQEVPKARSSCMVRTIAPLQFQNLAVPVNWDRRAMNDFRVLAA